MEVTEQYVNQCIEDFSDSCRDFLRTSLEEMYRNYESFVAERMLTARRRYRELIETMVQDSKPEESLDSLLSDPKEGTGCNDSTLSSVLLFNYCSMMRERPKIAFS